MSTDGPSADIFHTSCPDSVFDGKRVTFPPISFASPSSVADWINLIFDGISVFKIPNRIVSSSDIHSTTNGGGGIGTSRNLATSGGETDKHPSGEIHVCAFAIPGKGSRNIDAANARRCIGVTRA